MTTKKPAAAQTLRQLVANRRAELGLSLREAAAKSVVNGKQLISHGTINQIELGHHRGRFDDPDVLKGLALALELPVRTVREAARVPAKEPTEFRLPKKAALLSEAERKVVRNLVASLLELHGEKPEPEDR